MNSTDSCRQRPRPHASLRRGRDRRRRAPRRLARRPPGRARGRHGPVRLGQVDADAHPRRARQADLGHASRSPARTSGSLSDTDVTLLRRKHIGFVFQFFNLLPMLNAEENIALPLSIAGEKPDKEFFEGLLSRVGLADRRKHRPAELSGGQQQRVAIARSLVSRPTVVFADEPTGNLDSHTGHEILELLRAATAEYGQTTVMVTHDAAAATIADRILFLADGVIADELGKSEPAHDPGRDAANLGRDPGRARRPARAQAPDGADGGRDRPRRRDGHRHVRPHGLDRQRVRLDLHRRPPGLQRRRQRQARLRARRPERPSAAAADQRVAAPEGACAAGRRAGGRRRRRRGAADRQGRQGDRLRRRAEPRLQHRERRLAVQPADARRGEVADGRARS